MSYFLASAPRGSIFYHGDLAPDRPDDFEWLAFEVEHASIFASSRESRRPLKGSNTASESLDDMLHRHQASHDPFPPLPLNDQPRGARPQLQRPFIQDSDDDGDDDKDPTPRPPTFKEPMRGYMQIYRANCPLNLLYIDGQAAGKCPLDSLDSQNFLLLDYDTTSSSYYGEWKRAGDICKLAQAWVDNTGKRKIDGFIRMEVSFEIIYCDFSAQGGLDLVSIQSSLFRNETGEDEDEYHARNGVIFFEWLRAAARSYDGHPAGRVDVDWSSMVSAFAYSVNLSDPDLGRQDLPRVVNATREERRNIRARLHEVVTDHYSMAEQGVNWQRVVDMMVSRFSGRLWHLAHGNSLNATQVLAGVGTLIEPFINHLDSETGGPAVLHRCTQHYLDPVALNSEIWTLEDVAIHPALDTVSATICSMLFDVRQILFKGNSTQRYDSATFGASDSDVLNEAKNMIRALNDKLKWSTWKACGKCPSTDQICLISMFPAGAEEDYFHPSCKNLQDVMSSMGYWGFDASKSPP